MIQKMEMPKVKFYVPSYKGVAISMYWNIKSLGNDYRKIILIELPQKLIRKISEKSFDEIKEELIEEIKKFHNIKKLEEVKKELENYWNSLNNLFFTNLKKITCFDFKYKEYIVYITEIIRGRYSITNEVFTNPKLNIKTVGYITAEELLHLHYWDIFRKVIKNVEMPWKISKEVWEISEVIPEFILTDDSFKEFGWGKNLNRNYPFIERWKEKLNPLWKNKKNFKDFIIKAHKDIIK